MSKSLHRPWGGFTPHVVVAVVVFGAGGGLPPPAVAAGWLHMGYIGAMWAKMDRHRLTSNEILTQIVILHDLYAQKSQKAVFEPTKKSRPTTETWCGCML